MSTELPPPPPVVPPIDERGDEPAIRELWSARAIRHTEDSYAGIRISKFPEDLRQYEHLIWLSRADVVVELGCQFGGSTLWFRDRLQSLGRYFGATGIKVIAVDIDTSLAEAGLDRVDPAWRDDIELLEGDVTDPGLARRVADALPPGARCLVVEDSAHLFATTDAALRLYSGLVPPGGFFVVEDGCVDVEWMRIAESWPRGVLPALHEWLATEQGGEFTVRRDLELYGITCHPQGILQRKAAE